MYGHIQGLGWIVRRTADPLPQGQFYLDGIGLRELRRRDTDRARNIMAWMGMYSVLETIWQGQPHPPVKQPSDGEVVPIFRIRDWDTVIARLNATGGNFLSETPDADGTVYFTDPDGFVCGIRTPLAGSDSAPDLEADRRWPDDLVSLPDTPPLAAGLQDIGWLRLHVADPQALSRFYCQVVGLDVLENNGDAGVNLHLGGTCTLELAPGGKTRPTPGDRKEVPDVWILRGYGLAAFAEKMAAANVPLINELTLGEGAGALNYYADPEGHVFGYQQRAPYDPDGPASQRIEDRAAQEAWQRDNAG
jgi:predicted enzyme related to lactoylglutathione lyase